MAASKDAVPLLKSLADAYRDTRFEQATLKLYLDHLADIPLPLLKAAVAEHIRSSPWFPKISELRQAAARLANTEHFETLAPAPLAGETAAEVWSLIIDAQALEDAYYTEGRLEPAAWQSVAAAFDRLDRPFRAEFTREKLRRLQTAG